MRSVGLMLMGGHQPDTRDKFISCLITVIASGTRPGRGIEVRREREYEGRETSEEAKGIK